ncbi:MAG: sigma 54-interacting transcriptional regulator, partial [Nitrosopumilaceae archaeon]|nr:sigma 54-interacting transcriptional regulator [Nitrosopumilaceae archaeon]
MSQDYASMVENSYNTPPKYTEIKAGVPEDFEDITTLRDLLAIDYKMVEVRQQIRKNLISIMNQGGTKYPGIIGFDEDVIPALDRALLSQHDVFLIGQIGQAKTKLVETIATHLLSPIPVIKNSLTNDCPMDLPSSDLIALLEERDVTKTTPTFYISPESSDKIRNEKLDTEIEWLDGKSRFKYVLATPDISVKDLVGYIDAIKVAKKGVEMFKIDSYSPGQLMQAKHGLFCIDELPVLDPRKQVALLSVLQEGRFTTGSYPVIFKPKTVFFATANPIDYTHSGKIIEPLYDRLKSHIHTHYPKTLEAEMAIILQESKIPSSFIPYIVMKTLANLVQKTRENPLVNQEKGVSVRFGVHGLELLVGEAERVRSLSHQLNPVPRITDMSCLDQVAKFELSELDDTLENRKKVFADILQESIKESCLKLLESTDSTVLQSIKEEFGEKTFAVSSQMLWKNGSASYENQLNEFTQLTKLVNSKID